MSYEALAKEDGRAERKTYFRRASELKPTDVELNLDWAAAAIAAANLNEADMALSRLSPGTRSNDPLIANNFAYLAALVGQAEMRALQAAKANHQNFPDNPDYSATYAFVLQRTGRTREALALLASLPTAAASSPALAFTCGIVLADAGRTAEAHDFLARVSETGLTRQELQLLQAARSSAQ